MRRPRDREEAHGEAEGAAVRGRQARMLPRVMLDSGHDTAVQARRLASSRRGLFGLPAVPLVACTPVPLPPAAPAAAAVAAGGERRPT